VETVLGLFISSGSFDAADGQHVVETGIPTLKKLTTVANETGWLTEENGTVDSSYTVNHNFNRTVRLYPVRAGVVVQHGCGVGGR